MKRIIENGMLIDAQKGYEIEMVVGKISARYYEDTNTVVFYDLEKEDDIDTIVYYNYSRDYIENYIKENFVKTI